MRYDAFIERDLAAIPSVVAGFRSEHSAEETWTAVTRFAVLAFAPSQHSKHALLACLSAWDLRAVLGERFDEAIVACAVYASASRQPWSEPPILDPPPIEPDQRGDLEELRTAIASSDRLRAERWLAMRYRDPKFESDYFAAASDNFEDLGHGLIVTSAAWHLAELLGQQGMFTVLRVAVWEMVALGGRKEGVGSEEQPMDLDSLCGTIVDNIIANGGDIVTMHTLFLFDAALQTGNQPVIARVASHLGAINAKPSLTPHCSPPRPPIYNFARDYGSCLKAHAVARRLRTRFPGADFDGLLTAAHHNLDASPSFGEMAFA
jgi:hypothetical protein